MSEISSWNEVENRRPEDCANMAVERTRLFFIEAMLRIFKPSARTDPVAVQHLNVIWAHFYWRAWDNPDTRGLGAWRELAQPLEPEAKFSLSEEELTRQLKTIDVVVGLASKAAKAIEDNRTNLAWAYAAEASFWAGGLWMNESNEQYKINPAVLMAKKRHAENYAMTAEALNYWRENIDPTLSAEKAADHLLKVVPLSHKKLAQLVATERKKLL